MTTDTHALLLTDIVDSTRIAQQLGDPAMAALWETHDRVARDLLREWHGREIDKSDGFLLLFANAEEAVGYALAYHRALAELKPPLKARAGLHVGAVRLRENHRDDVARGAKPVEVEGLAKPTTARVMSLAQPGQTLLTAEARAALGAASLRLQSHGHWRMKGIEAPIEVHEVGDAQAPFIPPPDSAKAYRVVRRNELWLPKQELRHSLPAERDAFIGRDAALQELARRFGAGARVISILGIGGTGKSRLAQRFGWAWLGDFPGGVWFCDLSQARSLDGIVYAVAQGLDVPLGSADPVGQLSSAIAGRGACLVILDNFEQVSRYAEQTLGQWLNRAAEARFIVTTREVLGIAGEEAMALPPLGPADAVALFLRRAAAARDGFDPGAEDRATISRLVTLLDGLPLAIELAAARVRVMPPRTLLARMSERFKLLAASGGRRDRQATLRTTFDWSWEMLSAPEKSALAQLSVFEVGFTLEAAEAVLDLSGFDDPPWAVDVVQSLVDKSLVRPLGERRFGLLGSVQEYAAEHLATPGRFEGSGAAAQASAHQRHWVYYAALDERSAIADGCIETENLVAACRRATARPDIDAAIGSLKAAWSALRLRGPFRVGAELAKAIRELSGLNAGQHAIVQWVAGSAEQALGRGLAARACFEAGLADAREAGDAGTQAWLLCGWGSVMVLEGHTAAATDMLQQALAMSRELGLRELECRTLNELGALAHALARIDEARAHYAAALQLAREIGDRQREGGLLGNLGGLLHGDGKLAEARQLYERALEIARETGDRRWGGNTHCNLGLLLHEQGEPAEARRQFEAALVIARDMGHLRLESVVLCNLAIALEAQGEPREACACYEKAVVSAMALGDRRSEGQFRGYLGLLYVRLGRVGEGFSCLDAAESLLEAVNDRLSLGLVLCQRAKAEHLTGQGVAAAAALTRAELIARDTQAGPESELMREIQAVRDLDAQRRAADRAVGCQ